MTAPDNLLFYSVNSFLSFRINSLFYGHEHYVWCSPIYNPATLDTLHRWRSIPPTSSPFAIHDVYYQAVKNNDQHCQKIRENKAGIIKGSIEKLAQGVITIEDSSRIAKIVELSSMQDYRPLVYIIPKILVDAKLILITVDKSANPLSEEYLIPSLKKGEFEIIEPIKL